LNSPRFHRPITGIKPRRSDETLALADELVDRRLRDIIGQIMAADFPLLKEIPDSPAGSQAKWYLARMLSKGEGASIADQQHYTPEVARRLTAHESEEKERAEWAGFAARMGEILKLELEAYSDFLLVARIETSKNQRWRLKLEVEPERDHRISRLDWERQFEFKLEVRDAEPADAPTLADIERRCPILLGDTKVYFERGNDYFAFARLMEEYVIGIASVDGVPAAVTCGAKHTVRIAGVDHPIVTVIHLRVLPEHQRKGLWGAANRVLDRFDDNTDGSNAFISVNNAGMQHGFMNTPSKWNINVLKMQLSAATRAGAASGRAATPADAAAIVATLNAFHTREEMYVPYTLESLTARLERAPELYSWRNIRMTPRAIVGVWPAGESLCVVTEKDGKTTRSRRGMVLDYAIAPGGEEELVSLLLGACASLGDRGIDALSIFSSVASPGVDVIRSLADEVEEYNMWTPGLAVPSGAAERGLYVDPIYF
jgi:hypothetical protein